MKYLFSLALVLLLAPCFAQTKVDDVTVANSAKAGNTNLVLNGAGMRTKYFFDLYVCALYLPAKNTNGTTIVNDDKPMAVRLYIVSSMVTKDKMKESIMEGFKKSTGGNVGPYQARIDQMIGAIKEIKPNDLIELQYEPGKGVTLYQNNKALTTMAGLDFKKALFGIWLGGNAVDSGLRSKMLGLKS